MEENYTKLSTFSRYKSEINILGLLLMFFLGYATHDLVSNIGNDDRPNRGEMRMQWDSMERGQWNQNQRPQREDRQKQRPNQQRERRQRDM